jgi:hypothetical protein
MVSDFLGIHLIDWVPDGPGGAYAEPVMVVEGDGTHLVLEDLDRDGRLDVAACQREFGPEMVTRVIWLRNDGNLRFSVHELSSGGSSYFRWIQAADFDGDGDPDVAASRYQSAPRFHMFTNDGTGNFSEASMTFEGDANRGMLTFAIWPVGDGRHGILPGERVFSSESTLDWKIIVVPREELTAILFAEDGATKIVFSSQLVWVYRLQFSRDLIQWVDGSTAEGEPLSIPGTGAEITHPLEVPDDPDLYVRVFGERQE